MNLINYLNLEKHTHFTLVNCNPNDIITSNHITGIFENFNYIKNYYENIFKNDIKSIDDYIDFLFLKNLTTYEICIERINEKKIKKFEEIIAFFKKEELKVRSANVVKYISLHYNDIFLYKGKYIESTVIKLTFDNFITFNSGLVDSGLLECFLKKEPVLSFDKLDDLYPILKKHKNRELIKFFLEDEKFEKIAKYRFEELCNKAIPFLKNRNRNDLLEKLEKKIYDYCIKKYKEPNINIYLLNSILDVAYQGLYKIKSGFIHEILEMKSNVENKMTKLIEPSIFKFSSEPYFKYMAKLDKKQINTFNKYFTISHPFSLNGIAPKSKLEYTSQNYVPNIADYIGTNIRTNEYFTFGKILKIENSIIEFSMSLYYWIDEQRKDDFFNIINKIIEDIYISLNFPFIKQELLNDINALKSIFEDIETKSKKELHYHMGTYFTISLLEKILRNVYCQLHEEGFFKNLSATLGELLGKKNNENVIMSSKIGEDTIKWLRYYLITDEKGIGENLRNKLAHFCDIKLGDINQAELIKVMWMFIVTINSIFINIKNETITN